MLRNNPISASAKPAERHARIAWLAVVTGLAASLGAGLAGCSSGPSLSGLADAVAVTGAQLMPTTMVSTSDTAGLADASSAWSAKGSVTEIYTRIARGLNRCHLGYGKDLATEHLLYGQTPSGSTQALIRIHQRTAENRHGLIAFTYELSEVQGTTYVTAQNKLFDAARTRQLQAGATAWSNGGEVCEPLTVSEIPLPPGVTPAPVRNASAPKP